jgi:Plasmid encoded RepA protein
MGTVHAIVLAEGKQAALEAGHSRDVVEAVSSYLSNEDASIGFLYSGWCQTALPHKRIGDDDVWLHKGPTVSLTVEPGTRVIGDRAVRVGVPYGSRARLILIYLQTEAMKRESPEVELGRSLRHWLGKMEIPIGGKSVSLIRDQADRISRCRLTFHAVAGKKGIMNQSIVETAMFEDDGGTWEFVEAVKLSDGFYQHLKKHPVPIEDAALKALANNSQALDIYCWLAYRLHVLTKPTPLSWRATKEQFGQSVAVMKNFKVRFLPNLAMALEVYPAAKVELTDAGLLLHPSRPPVAPKQFQLAVA